jgi:hypothetical protein
MINFDLEFLKFTRNLCNSVGADAIAFRFDALPIVKIAVQWDKTDLASMFQHVIAEDLHELDAALDVCQVLFSRLCDARDAYQNHRLHCATMARNQQKQE